MGSMVWAVMMPGRGIADPIAGKVASASASVPVKDHDPEALDPWLADEAVPRGAYAPEATSIHGRSTFESKLMFAMARRATG